MKRFASTRKRFDSSQDLRRSTSIWPPHYSASADPAVARLAKERGVVVRFVKPVDVGGLTRLLRSLFPTEGTSADRPPAISRQA